MYAYGNQRMLRVLESIKGRGSFSNLDLKVLQVFDGNYRWLASGRIRHWQDQNIELWSSGAHGKRRTTGIFLVSCLLIPIRSQWENEAILP